MKLMNETKNLELASHVEQALSFKQRAQGLLGRHGLPEKHSLWIQSCNSIHTWFMKFSIDAIFVGKDLRVRKVFLNLKPWDLTLPRIGADSVFEFQSGQLKGLVEKGDQLRVVH
tara:strand:- start:431 stop:772 length:342 start_codon:yes stop_codon:yes gene_type:complete